MSKLSIKVKLFIILAIVTIGSLLAGLYVNSRFAVIAQSNPDISNELTTINISIAILIVINLMVVFLVSKQIAESVNSIGSDVSGFFDFLEQKPDDFKPIQVKNQKELGFISKELKSHASLTKDSM